MAEITGITGDGVKLDMAFLTLAAVAAAKVVMRGLPLHQGMMKARARETAEAEL